MAKRTQTYVAGDWDGDNDAIEQLKTWNKSDHWSLSFYDVHEKTQSRDSSLNCSIKKSLQARMDVSKRFILVVGEHTKTVTSGSCGQCAFHEFNYCQGRYICKKGYAYDSRSYVKFECEKAIEAGIEIIVLYNSTTVDKSLCPSAVRDVSTHVAMKCWKHNMFGSYIDWNYQAVKKAFGY